MEIFVRDAKSKTGKWHPGLLTVSVCELTSRQISKGHIHFGAVGRGSRMYDGTMWQNVSSNLSVSWVAIPVLYFDFIC